MYLRTSTACQLIVESLNTLLINSHRLESALLGSASEKIILIIIKLSSHNPAAVLHDLCFKNANINLITITNVSFTDVSSIVM